MPQRGGGVLRTSTSAARSARADEIGTRLGDRGEPDSGYEVADRLQVDAAHPPETDERHSRSARLAGSGS